MAYGLPAHGEANWDTKISASLTALQDGTVVNDTASGTRAALDGAYTKTGETVIHAGRYASLQAALDAARTAPAGGVRRVLAPGTYNITTTLLVGSNTILDGGGTGSIVKETGDYKVILNYSGSGTSPINTDTRITIRDIAITGTPASGTEQNAGIHFAKVTDSLIENVSISNVRGDGVTLGNVTGGITDETVSNVVVRNCHIDNAGRQGIALTNAKSCSIVTNYIANCSVGAGVDLEPDIAGQYISDILVLGNTITGCASGIVGSSVANVDGTSAGNRILDNSISSITNQGIQNSYSYAVIRGNVLSSIGKEGIKITRSIGLAYQTIQGNQIIDASQTTDNTYPAILIDNCTHSAISTNVIIANATNKVSKLWDETGTSAYNSFVGNNGRQVAKAYAIVSTSNASHNLLSSAAIQNRHEGFYAMGTVDMNGNPVMFTETTDPATPSANRVALYAKDDGAGNTQVVAKFPSGGVRVVSRDNSDSAPIALTLTAPWANYGSSYATAAYYKDAAGWVHLMGTIAGGAVGQNIATLPAGYRPTLGHMMGPRTQDGTTNNRIDVMTTGVIAYQVGSGVAVGYLTLDGISFYAG